MQRQKRCFFLFALGLALTLSCGVDQVLVPEIGGVDDNWELTESKHYYLYYRPQSETAEEIKYIQGNLDYQFRDIVKTLNVTYENKISCYIYSSREDFQKGEDTRSTAHAFPELEKISGYHHQIRSSAKHESVHVIAYWTIGTCKFRFLSEGLARGVGDYFYPSLNWRNSVVHVCGRELLADGKLLTISQLADNAFFKTLYGSEELRAAFRPYDQSASFVGFLIGQHGLDRFKSFYAKANRNNYQDIFSCTYGKSIEDFEAEWHEFLRTY